MNNKLLIFNWKMNPISTREALILAKASDYKNIVIAPPFLFLERVGRELKNAELGAQDVFWENPCPSGRRAPAGGAFTGEISSSQLKNIGVSYVIIGHSERRHKMGETDEMIAGKVAAAVSNGLTAVLCVGETEQERNAGKTEEVIKRQLEIGLSLLKLNATSDKRQGKRQGGIKKSSLHVALSISLIVAYEPVWAIGTGNPQTPESALKTINYIKSLIANRYTLNAKVLYGGSVNSQNLKNYIEYKEIDGALVGGASLKKDEVQNMALLSAGRSAC